MIEKTERRSFVEIMADSDCEWAEGAFATMCDKYLEEGHDLGDMCFALLAASLEMAGTAAFADELRFLEATRNIAASRAAHCAAAQPDAAQWHHNFEDEKYDTGARH